MPSTKPAGLAQLVHLGFHMVDLLPISETERGVTGFANRAAVLT